MPEIGALVSGKYRILEEIGAGAMGIVFLAVHVDTDKQVALKWLNPALTHVPSAAERFRREAKATGRIHHPNVIAVHDYGEHAGQLYMVLEHVAGRTLREHLSRAPGRRLSLEDALELMFPIMRGVAAAHAVGVLHRDLKPENVLLADSPDGLRPVPKVLDFGLAKVRNEASFAAKLSLPGSVLGTYQYMAPEQLKPHATLDERSDVYALGAILYEMLSGGPPYRASNPIDLVLEMQASEVPLLDADPSLPEGLSEVIAGALTRDPAQRYPSVDALAGALEPFTPRRFRGLSGQAHAPDAAAPQEPPTQTHLTALRALAHGSRPASFQRVRLALAVAALFLPPGRLELDVEAKTTPAERPAPARLSAVAPPPTVTNGPRAAPPRDSDWATPAPEAAHVTELTPDASAAPAPPPRVAAEHTPSSRAKPVSVKPAAAPHDAPKLHSEARQELPRGSRPPAPVTPAPLSSDQF